MAHTLLVSCEQFNKLYGATLDPLIIIIILIYRIGPPPTPAPPTVKVLSSNSLSISWIPVWSFPVNSYTLEYTNTTTTDYIVTGNDTSVVLFRENISDIGECGRIEFRVQVLTDLGITDYSEVTVGRFAYGTLME